MLNYFGALNLAFLLAELLCSSFWDVLSNWLPFQYFCEFAEVTNFVKYWVCKNFWFFYGTLWAYISLGQPANLVCWNWLVWTTGWNSEFMYREEGSNMCTKSIASPLFGESEKVWHWPQLCTYSGFYLQCLKHFWNDLISLSSFNVADSLRLVLQQFTWILDYCSFVVSPLGSAMAVR